MFLLLPRMHGGDAFKSKINVSCIAYHDLFRHHHVAAHQVGLSLWLIFALIQDGAAVAAQVLMSQAYAPTSLRNSLIKDRKPGADCRDMARIRSLTFFMIRLAVFQSLICSASVFFLGRFSALFVSNDDPLVLQHLQSLMPIIMAFQPLVSLTLVLESLVVGAKMFNLLAIGTTVATVTSMFVMRGASSIAEIWRGGLVLLFLGRLITSVIGVGLINDVWTTRYRRIKTDPVL